MVLHQNIHPSYVESKPRKWTSIQAQFNGENDGCCVNLMLHDETADDCCISLHFGEIVHAQEFVDKLKTAILSLPAIVRKDA